MIGMYLRGTLLIIVSCVSFVWCFIVIPERSNVTYINEKYIVDVKLYVRRYGRRSSYYLNFEGTTKHSWDNNVTINILFYEYLHNEYRRSFIEFHYKFCDLLAKEPYIGGMLKSKGFMCPNPANEYHLMNITFPTENFPNVFPFQKGRVEFEGVTTQTGETFIKMFADVLFKDVRKPPKLSKNKLLGSE